MVYESIRPFLWLFKYRKAIYKETIFIHLLGALKVYFIYDIIVLKY